MGRAGADPGQGHAGGPAGGQTQLRPQAVQAHISQSYLLLGTELKKGLVQGRLHGVRLDAEDDHDQRQCQVHSPCGRGAVHKVCTFVFT